MTETLQQKERSKNELPDGDTLSLPKGYKQTKIGLLPEEWEVKSLAQLGDFERGRGIPKRDVVERGVPAIRYGEIYTTHHFYIKEFVSFIKDDSVIDRATRLYKNDILFASSGETLDEIGKSVAFIGSNEAYAGGDIIIFRNHKFKTVYLAYQLNSKISRRQFNKLGQGQSVVHVYPSSVKTLKIPVPPIAEQRAIADCLTTWDDAIGTLTKLIAAKQERKKGLMQRLLTGKQRLPGFTEEWKEVKLGEVVAIEKGKTITSNSAKSGKYPVIAGGKTSPYSNNDWNYNDVITVSASGAYAGYVQYHKGKIWASDCSVLQSKVNKSILKFVYAYLKLFQRKLYLQQTGGAQPHIYPNDLKTMIFEIPPIKEQRAIANILTTADKEIDLLQQQLQHYKLQKKGLMQLLLTGKKRLIENGELGIEN